nr:MAG TPA: hypothetical protein [Caudoviricetes sp.]
MIIHITPRNQLHHLLKNRFLYPHNSGYFFTHY